MRTRFGDWEGDSVKGSKGSGAIASHVERKSRYLVAAKLSDKKADTMTQKTIKAFWRVPKVMRKTLTVNNGKEFSLCQKIELKTGLTIYFVDPFGPEKEKSVDHDDACYPDSYSVFLSWKFIAHSSGSVRSLIALDRS